MKVGSLFTGYGGLDTAVGGELAWYAEIDKAACEVLAYRYPGVPNLGDITKIDWTQVEPVDVLTGGYPCQPFSHAGLRKGKNDDRHLWPYVRDAIDTLRPEYAVLENVSGHITLGFANVLSDLATIGFDAEWGTFRASDVGAPHQRKRLFIIAYPARGTWGEGQGRDYQKSERSTRLATHTGSPITNTDSDGHGQQLHAGRMGSVEQSKKHGHGASLTQDTRRQHDNDTQENFAPSLYRSECCPTDWGKYAPAIRRWESVLDRPAPAANGAAQRQAPPQSAIC
jgi:DNA (cytosine-5)-methyltransferase 1